MATVFINARVIKDGKILQNHGVAVDNGRILYCGKAPKIKESDIVIDARGNYLSAGFIDLHIHGGNNFDFMDATFEAMLEIAKYHSMHGVTSMLATSLAGSEEETMSMLETYKAYAPRIDCVNYLGVHLEGPYLSLEQKGAQDPRYLAEPKREQYEKFLSTGCIKRMSAAPELDGAMELGRYLQRRGVIASVAHTNATFETVQDAVGNGYSLVTHLYCGMSGVHKIGAFRYGGAVEAGLYFDELTTEIIADGCHLPKSLLKFIYKCKGKDKIILTSDAMRGAGLPEGSTTKLGSLTAGQNVIIEDGVAKLPDRTSFAGSVASADRLIRTMVKAADVPLCEAVGMMTANPAKLLGMSDRKGGIDVGMDADIVVFDEDINIKHTMVMGKLIEI